MDAFVTSLMLLSGIAAAESDGVDTSAKMQIVAQATASARIIQAEKITLDARMFDGENSGASEPASRSYTIRIKAGESELRLTEFH